MMDVQEVFPGVLEYFFTDPRRADRSYIPVVQAYSTYHERERRSEKKA
jgi:hypothetical protein